MTVALIDNYDSFSHNLARYIRECGQAVEVIRNDAMMLAEIEATAPSHVVISPGPCTPERAGISLEAVRFFAGRRLRPFAVARSTSLAQNPASPSPARRCDGAARWWWLACSAATCRCR